MAPLTYNALKQFLRKLKHKLDLRTRNHLHKLNLRIRNLFRRPSLSTPDIKSTEYIWQEIFHHRIYFHPHLKVGAEPLNVVFDIGANVGVYAAWAAQEYSPRRIYCYEASPITFRYLRRNVKKLGQTHKATEFYAINAAVSNTEGDERLIYHRPDKIGGSTLLDQGEDRGGKPLSVRATSLSRQLSEHGIDMVDMLKIDVEGHYMQVLQGISDFSKIRRIVLECDWIPEGAPSPHSTVQFLQDKGYSVVLDDPTKRNNITVYARQTHSLHSP